MCQFVLAILLTTGSSGVLCIRSWRCAMESRMQRNFGVLKQSIWSPHWDTGTLFHPVWHFLIQIMFYACPLLGTQRQDTGIYVDTRSVYVHECGCVCVCVSPTCWFFSIVSRCDKTWTEHKQVSGARGLENNNNNKIIRWHGAAAKEVAAWKHSWNVAHKFKFSPICGLPVKITLPTLRVGLGLGVGESIEGTH